MIRVVVTGSECTGKTTLARGLADRYGAPWTAEYARQFVAAKGGPVERPDVGLIAHGQIEEEDRIRLGRPVLLIKDTDLLSTLVYCRHYWADTPAWIEAELADRRGDLYLLAGIDVPWLPDGDQRDREDSRVQMQELFRRALAERRLPSVELPGSRAARLSVACEAIDAIIGSGRAFGLPRNGEP